ncbi:Non-specific serine/threonine protein kinase protein [Dioscorea alata]|uniref:Non-specific serine/threonine protein kinase protein n=1 Tax=Dioscorea alata TaxID=55571 RepID=A0ACB7WGJ9_DIOAL|nr:Non-specific serine/threonine protein kinase protein [Dioscorea alata]
MQYSWLLIVLKLLPLIQPCSSSLSQYSVTQQQDVPAACNITNIHYPFGIPNVSTQEPMRGFEILCNSSSPMMVQLDNNLVEVKNISSDGQIRVLLKTFASRCARGSLEESQDQGQEAIANLENTPYTFSHTMNKLIVVGCDAFAIILAPDHSTVATGCTSFCISTESVTDGVCAGVGCCQANIPPGLKSITLNFISIRNITGAASKFRARPVVIDPKYKNLTGNEDYGECSKVFVMDPNKFTFSRQSLSFQRQNHDKDMNEKGMEVVLDWSIGNKTCAQACFPGNSNCACVSTNSYCNNSLEGLGYRCYCSDGYRGNPYLKDGNGCKDIDECAEGQNDCVSKCKNTEGGYECSCPFGTKGDGRRRPSGSGCKRLPPLDIVLGVGFASLITIFIISSWSYWAFKKHKIRRIKQKYFLKNGGLLLQQHVSSQVAIVRIFTVKELELATDGFHESRILGHGGYGTVYKGILPDNQPVAIKRSKLVDESQIESFINEVVILSQVNHRNVVKLLGCCLETQVPLLVYEFISNGTLFQHLHAVRTSTTSPMNWDIRLRIAVETAAALAYLHGVTSTPIIHRDVKSSNILVDENYTAKVSDFGASRLVPHNRTHVTTVVQGTLGYLDPEYFHTGLLTDKSDVYSFGVVLVELLTREDPVSFGRLKDDGNLILHFVTSVEENRLIEELDKETIEEAGIMQLLAVAQLAEKCLNVKGEQRPTMAEVAVELEALRRLMNQHFVQKGKDIKTSPATSLAFSDMSTQDSMKSMESHLPSES